jgi:4'-phosphopantetheinyl transferase EntD
VALAVVPEDFSTRAAWERAYLSPAEAALLGAQAVPKRRAEFVAGRLAAKGAAGRLLGRSWDDGDLAVLRQGEATTGPPRLVLSGAPCEVRCSISHADGVAVAAASREDVGIDVVAIEHQDPAFEAEAFAPGELETWRRWLGDAGTREEAVAVAFAAKEATLKWMGTGLTVPLHAVAVLPVGAGPPAAGLSEGSAGLRVLRVHPGRDDALVALPETTLRVSIEGRRPRRILSARILRLDRRIVFLLCGADGARRNP